MLRWWMVLAVASGCFRGPASQVETNAGVFADADAGDGDAGALVVDGGPPEPPPRVTSTGCWSVPVVLGAASSWGRGSLVVLPSGDALVAWVENAQRPRVFSRFVFLDGGTSAPEEVYAAPVAPLFDQEVADLRLSSNRAGLTALVWSHRGDGGAVNELLLTTRQLGASWNPEEVISPSRPERIIWADVGVAQRGQLYVAWSQPSLPLTAAGLHFRSFSPDGGWSAQATITPPGTVLASTSTLAVGEQGEALLAWQGYYPPDLIQELHATSLHPSRWVDSALTPLGSGWVPPVPVAIALDGGAAVAWLDGEVRVARQRSGSWSAPDTVPLDAGVGPVNVLLGIDDLGVATAWGIGWNRSEYVFWSATDEGAGWSTAVPFSFQGEPGRFFVHASNGRQELVSWSRGTTVFLLRRALGGSVIDTIDGLTPDPPRIAVGQSGARWILAHLNEPGTRPVAMFCP